MIGKGRVAPMPVERKGAARQGTRFPGTAASTRARIAPHRCTCAGRCPLRTPC